MKLLQGIPVSPGVVIARALVLEKSLHRVPFLILNTSEVPAELERFSNAIQSVHKEVERDKDQVEETLGAEPAKIFSFHLGLLNDVSLIEPIRNRIKNEGVNASFAVVEAFGELADKFRSMDNPVFRDKANDVFDLERRLMNQLTGGSKDRLASVEEPVIVICHQVTPGDAATFNHNNVLGIATDIGGRTDHSSIVAAAIGIPVVVGCKSVAEEVSDGDMLILDGKTGTVIIDPDEGTLARMRQNIELLESFKQQTEEISKQDSVTLDGEEIHLYGNIEFAHEIEQVIEKGGEGVGLYRTEFQYLTTSSLPTEDELFDEYTSALYKLEGRTLTIRTLDLGADKYTQAQAMEPERNPFLGLRSIRYCLQHQELFRTQLRAIIRASSVGPLRIMFPLITSMNELRQAKLIFNEVLEECDEEGIKFSQNIPVGMMVEVPSAALMAATFTREVDFFSIGTNDLIQYTVAVDRGNERVASLYTATNPAVIKLIKSVIRAARRGKVETSLCGEIAGDPVYTMLLIGLGLRNLSLVPSQIPAIKQVIRKVTVDECERLARKIGSLDSDRRILSTLRDELQKKVPEAIGGWSAEQTTQT
ncbi:MAG: phosphoenolpyruvate--protein phosphotransferase [Phycisphaerales bacterium]|nr:phosphoenolpyruvate--protein phosphotransferase [Planctomycetota bacterium]MBL6997871.1 phosphoenolpyruvate--protein phosphotransferase [Phycisphaerales bacterium]